MPCKDAHINARRLHFSTLKRGRGKAGCYGLFSAQGPARRLADWILSIEIRDGLALPILYLGLTVYALYARFKIPIFNSLLKPDRRTPKAGFATTNPAKPGRPAHNSQP